ncbi:uncharacterized protein PHACADRAFT_258875 [Phanerochaete carnosa HHB-10118-sp]|uniref:C2 domain-containing protein n=1 Tax=Phanerochaete carnosa (strain HHB-10118-sp) TaxID=650164 RepID=K5VTE2_PHACS|nr:uncharacterized protein PHACADRAFT_258875 [Phanerochaete carnosa HHB-10118-sp]EKM54783.1 hypothetical protein PHACADRAFT_258875 [Phanerochaete carnosa HHB-10118-sp]
MTSDETLYTCKITFIKATSVPVADFNDLSCDPYLQATLTAEKGLEQPDGIPQMLTYRTQTCRRTLDPEFNAHWVVSGIPQSGFLLSVRLRDEDPGNYDDDLGKTVLRMPNAGEGVLAEGWRSGDREYKVHKRRGSIMSKLFTCTANVLTRGDVGHRVRLWVRCEVMGKAEDQKDRRMYTVGPHDNEDPQGEEKDRAQDGEGAKNKDSADGRDEKISSDSIAMARQFLRMTSYGTYGRIFTYVIMLDGEWRFTETGDQMAIEFLSKHTMHSDVTIEIAYSGEFFVRPLRYHRTAAKDPSPGAPEPAENTHTDDRDHNNDQDHGQDHDHGRTHDVHEQAEDEHFNEADPPDDPALYELVIDNDSGTYRPRADLLPVLHAYLASPRNLGALGRVTTLNAFDERLKRWKEARKKAKAQKGERLVRADSAGSASSAGSSVSGVSGAEGVTTGDMRAVVEEDAKRARENQDQDAEAKREEGQADAEGGEGGESSGQ